MSHTEKSSGARLLHLDLIRTIACLSVVMIHVSAEFVIRGTTGPDFLLGNLLDSLSRAGVPLFVMISGALMLDEGYVFTKKKWLSHIGRMTVFYIVWSVIYGLLNGGLGAAFSNIFSCFYHLWYIPMIIGLYLLVPLMRLWVKEENIRFVEYFLLLSLVFAFLLPQIAGLLAHVPGAINPFQSLAEHMNLQYVAGYTAYFILGWYLNRGIRRTGLICTLGIIGICITYAGTHFAAINLNADNYPFYENFTLNVLMHSASIFVLCRSLFGPERPSGKFLRKLTGWFSQYSLGIYAVHIFFISRLTPMLGHLHIAAALPLIFILTFVVSAFTSMILKKIPILKKII